VANKKCPKCGEDNPAEAVMCWACYTPLTAGASATMSPGAASGARTSPRGGGKTPAAMPATDEEKKKTDPRLFFAGGGLLVAGLAFVFFSGILGGGGGGDAGVTQTSGKPSFPGSSLRPSGGGNGPPVPFPPPPPPPPPPNGNTPPVQPVPAPYSVVVPPNPRFTTATLAITPTNQTGNAKDALGLAKAARQDLQSRGKWTITQIVVFPDRKSAGVFQEYMSGRRGAPLDRDNYSELADKNAWANATVYYTSTGNRESYYYPAVDPKNWWNDRQPNS